MDKIKGIAGVILAGGRSTRFGSNKALAIVNGKPLIHNVADLMSGLFQECLLVTNTPEEYDFLSLPMTSDRHKGSGPLAGIHAALQEVSETRAFVVACDMPNLSPELIQYLCSINEQDYDAIIPMLKKGLEPLFGIYHKKALPVIEAHLQKKAKAAEMISGPGHPLWQIGQESCDGKPYVDLDSCTYILGLIGLNDAVKCSVGFRLRFPQLLLSGN